MKLSQDQNQTAPIQKSEDEIEKCLNADSKGGFPPLPGKGHDIAQYLDADPYSLFL